MIAALQMYDWPEVHPRIDAFWALVYKHLKQAGINAPATLSRLDPISQGWTKPNLLLGQTCGLPYVSGRCGDAVLVAQPVFDVEGAMDGTYSSALVCRIYDPANGLSGFRGRIAAINEFGSQSGCNALADAVLEVHADPSRPFFTEVRLSEAHRNSATMVAKGQADIAAIDAVAWALYAETEPENHAKLRVLSWTRPMPALPYITASQYRDHVPVLFESLQKAASEHALATLPVGMKRIVDADYDPIRKMADRVRSLQLATDAPKL